jgi:hypothetical protein
MLTRVLMLAACLAVFTACPQQACAAAPDRVQVFAFPQPILYTHHNDDFTVRVRTPGGVWQDLYEFTVKVDQDTKQEASMVYFNFDGAVEVAVQKNNGTFAKVAVRPDSKGVKAVVKGDIAYFTLTRPENLSVEFDGDRLHNLHIFTHAIRKDMPAQPAGLKPADIKQGKAPDLTAPVVYFGPGIHRGDFRLRSNTTVYIDGSAMLKDPLVIDGIENVKVISDGLFDSAAQTRIRNAKNILIDGPIFFNQEHGTMICITSQDVEERSIRTIGGGKWSDGLGHFACERVKISDSFIRTSDDCITLYNHRWDIWGSTRDVVVTNSTLWADVAHAVLIGLHGNTPSAGHPEAEVIERARFNDIDILEHDEDVAEYQGALAIMAGDDNLVRDVTFENIRVERIKEGKLFNFHIAYAPEYNTSPGHGIENITLRNVSFSGNGSPGASVIYGYDQQRQVRNIVLDNVTVGGTRLTGPERNVLDIGSYVDGVSYK